MTLVCGTLNISCRPKLAPNTCFKSLQYCDIDTVTYCCSIILETIPKSSLHLYCRETEIPSSEVALKFKTFIRLVQHDCCTAFFKQNATCCQCVLFQVSFGLKPDGAASGTLEAVHLRFLCLATLPTRANATSATAPGPLVWPVAVLPGLGSAGPGGPEPLTHSQPWPVRLVSSLIILWRVSRVTY